MADVFALFVFALVQGIAEWLPISSSGHLIIAEHLLNYQGGLLLEVTLHFGTLMAVFVYFGREITDIFQDLVFGRWKSERAQLAFKVALATIPGAIVGYSIKDYFESVFSSLQVVALGLAITSVLLVIASFQWTNTKSLSWGSALLIGCAQAVAIVPGISRSGATVAAGLLLGMKEKDSLKFSFLMSIPIIFGANVATLGFSTEPLSPSLLWTVLLCFVVALVAIHVLYKHVLTSRKNLRWFAAYCFFLALGIGLYLLLS